MNMETWNWMVEWVLWLWASYFLVVIGIVGIVFVVVLFCFLLSLVVGCIVASGETLRNLTKRKR